MCMSCESRRCHDGPDSVREQGNGLCPRILTMHLVMQTLGQSLCRTCDMISIRKAKLHQAVHLFYLAMSVGYVRYVIATFWRKGERYRRPISVSCSSWQFDVQNGHCFHVTLKTMNIAPLQALQWCMQFQLYRTFSGDLIQSFKRVFKYCKTFELLVPALCFSFRPSFSYSRKQSNLSISTLHFWI